MARLSKFLAVGGCMLLAASTGAALAARPCLEVDSPGAVLLPDGRQFAARCVQLCQADPYTPATSILEVRIDGVSVGLFLAEVRSGGARPPTGPAFVTFDRLGIDRPYRLVSLTVSDGDATVSHRLRGAQPPVVAKLPPSGEPPSGEIVTVVARQR